MAADGSGATSNDVRIADRLARWPGVSRERAECGTGTALAAGGVQIVHLHGGAVAELRLTRPVIGRLGEVLADSGRVAFIPGGEWVAVRLDTDSDLAMVASLASVAIKAGSAPGAVPRPGAPCSAAAGGIAPDRLAALVTAGGGSPMPLSQFRLMHRTGPPPAADGRRSAG
ncbi:luciferase family protein [Spirillospora sp. NPDC029432]|uniref:luciferase domain-containing protein n=1 Tax=Spirillospora sp. NPDC029432 TaxID=3154599 RepID=UPI0034568F11